MMKFIPQKQYKLQLDYSQFCSHMSQMLARDLNLIQISEQLNMYD